MVHFLLSIAWQLIVKEFLRYDILFAGKFYENSLPLRELLKEDEGTKATSHEDYSWYKMMENL